MKTILNATGFVAALGVLTIATFSADMGYATEAKATSEQAIIIDPAKVEPAEAAAPAAEHLTAEHPGKAPEIVNVPQPVEGPVAPVAPPKPTAASLAELVAMQPTTVADAEMECLAGTVYFESKGESLAGQLAVAEVVINRKNSPRFPNSICGVVYQKSQFSFVRSGKMPAINKDSKAWRNAVAIAHIAMNEHWESPVKGSLFFHATYVSPGWRLTRTGTIGNHVFYR